MAGGADRSAVAAPASTRDLAAEADMGLVMDLVARDPQRSGPNTT